MTTEQSVFERIDNERKRKHISQKSFCEQLGVKQQAYTNWKGGDNTSFMKKLPQIAEILDVALDYLLRGFIKEPDTYGDNLLNRLIRYFNECDEDGKLRIIQIAMNEYDRSESERKKAQAGNAVSNAG